MEPDNYGRESERPVVPAPGGISAADERSWSALAHLTAFLNLITGFLGPVAAFVVWLVYRERSETVAYHAMRSVVYQAIWLAVLWIGWTVTLFLIFPIILVAPLTLAFFGHAAFEAYRAYQGYGRPHV